MKIVSIILLVVSAFLSIKHGWDAFKPPTAQQEKMMSTLGITKSVMPYFGVLSIVLGLMLLLPQTFFVSNILNAVIIVLIMAFSLRAGDYITAVIEIPFLALPLILIWLKYPFEFLK